MQVTEKGSKYDKAMHNICRMEEKELLEKYIDAQMELNSLTAEAFVTGGDLVVGA